MSNLGDKLELLKALGLTPVTAETKAMASFNTTPNSSSSSGIAQPSSCVQRRYSRRRKRPDGTRNHVFHFLTDEHIKDGAGSSSRKKLAISNNTPATKAVPSATITTSPQVGAKPTNLQALQKNVVFLPNAQNQQGIVLGQTIFQGPDGKKFVLIPSTASRPQDKASTLVPQSSSAQASILPLTGNMNMNASHEIPANQSYIYLPPAQRSAKPNGKPLGPSLTNILPGPSLTNIMSNSSLVVTPTTCAAQSVSASSTQATEQATKTSNIFQLLNLKRSASKDTQIPINSMNLSIWPQGGNQTFQLVKIQKGAQPVLTDLTAGSLGLPSCVSLSASGMSRPVLSTSSPSRSDSIKQLNKLHKRVLEGGIGDVLGAVDRALSSNPSSRSVSSSNAHIPSNRTEPNRNINGPSSHLDIVTGHASSTEPGRYSSSSNSCTSINSYENAAKIRDTVVKSSERTSMDTGTSVIVVPGPKSSAAPGIVKVRAEFDTATHNSKRSSTQGNHHDRPSGSSGFKSAGGLKGDPKMNFMNPETNCVVIQGKNKKKRGRGRGFESNQRRRYGGPPFTPCNAPPSPNTPGSATCCLYEHTLLKMATRGFWGCDMGKLQDVFRSIRCESIDFDTMEDVTKRCYQFVRRKLLDAADGTEAMYKYMKNYIDEFDR